jgi:hypothetical protein
MDILKGGLGCNEFDSLRLTYRRTHAMETRFYYPFAGTTPPVWVAISRKYLLTGDI